MNLLPQRLRSKVFFCGIPVFLMTAMLTILSCSSPQYSPVKMEMNEIYHPAYELYTLVWSPQGFSDPAQHAHIASLLDSLSKDFHKVGKAKDLRSSDPGISVTLDVTQRLLNDTKRRFDNGDVDYARWRLKGLIYNCISCHTRTQPSAPFYGAAPVGEPKNFDSGLNSAEFLIASRQFDEAGVRLIHLAERAALEPEHSSQVIPVMRLWLLLKVRVTDVTPRAIEELESFAHEDSIPEITKRLFLHWVVDLRALAAGGPSASPIDTAEAFLSPIRENDLIAKDDWNLVNTLRASTLLHELLENRSNSETIKRRASFLLAISYQHVNILPLLLIRDLYLERFIRTYPGTPDAKAAFLIYEKNIRNANSGSGGTHLDEDDAKLIEELSKIANQTST